MSEMTAWAWIDGAIVPARDARVPVLDRGFLHGDGVFEVLRTARRRPFALDRHLARLAAGAAALDFAAADADAIADAVRRTAAKIDGEARIRIVATRDTPCIVIAEPLVLPPDDVYERGIALVTIARPITTALDPRIKALAFLDHRLALDDARRAGADEAVRLDASGRVAECATANLFAVIGGALVTPPAIHALPGVTRALVMELTPVREYAPLPAELAEATEIFVTSSVRGVVPVASLDGKRLAVGPVARRVRDEYSARLDA
jgi:branched-chain amino acid aminotransferase